MALSRAHLDNAIVEVRPEGADRRAVYSSRVSELADVGGIKNHEEMLARDRQEGFQRLQSLRMRSTNASKRALICSAGKCVGQP